MDRIISPHDLLPNAPAGAAKSSYYFDPAGPQAGSCPSALALEQMVQNMVRSDVLSKKHFETRWVDPISKEQILSCTTPVEPVAARRSAPGSRLVEAMINTSKICTKMSSLVAGASEQEVECLDDGFVGPPAPKKVTCCACIYAARNGPFGDRSDHHEVICKAYVKDPKMWEPETCDHVQMFPITDQQGTAGGLEKWLTSRNPACTDIRMVTYGHSNAPFLDERQLPLVKCIEKGGKTICSIRHQDCGCSSFGDCGLVTRVAEAMQKKLKASNCNAWVEFNGSPRSQHLPVRLSDSRVCWKNPNGWCDDEYDWLKVMVHQNWIAYYKYDAVNRKWIKITKEQFNSYCTSRRRAGPPVSPGK